MLYRYALSFTMLGAAVAMVQADQMSNVVREINDMTEFRNATKDETKVYVVKFYASWCGPCRQYGPRFEEFAKNHQQDNVVYLAVNVDKGSVISNNYQVQSLPTTVIIKGGKEVERFVGGDVRKLESLVKKYSPKAKKGQAVTGEAVDMDICE